MSLDITIISPEPIKKKSTGIYARIDGQTLELTKEEAIAHFPDVDPDSIIEEEIETDEFWHGNITHNLCRMTEDCMSFDEYDQCYNLYDLLWRDTQAPFEGNYINAYIAHLAYCLYVLKNDPEHFKQFNPPNGWGTYEQLIEFVRSFIHALINMPEGSTIEYSK